ncbi:MAG TPA: sialate O-acetylesterase, partial [Flavitalea sp.]|nr:sialate O-acetylesterase [Flavitalea sp.]
NMVLQQDTTVKLWGWADPNEKILITTSWNGKIYNATGSRDAKWSTDIETPKAGGPFTISFKGKNSLLLTNILIGELWLCSGQSNMEMSGNWGLSDIEKEKASANNDKIRFFSVVKNTADYPQDQIRGHWKLCDSNSLMDFSAVGYFFGKRVNERLGFPVGLINASWGGTAAEVWTPDSIINNQPVLKEAARIIQPSAMCPYIPGHTYNAMIAPLTSMAIAGVVWYQGENNTEAANTYNLLFTTMIKAWRTAWNQNFPFYYVQIAPYRYKKANSGALLREAQLKSAEYPNTGMVVITDLVTDVNDVHPKDKHNVGYRLANLALSEHYQIPGLPHKYPMPGDMHVIKNRIMISIKNAPNGLTTKGAPARELYIAGTDSVFHLAKASTKDTTITVWNKDVKDPIAVRFSFSDTAIGNIFSGEGLPLSPFRTDKWPIVADGH